MRIGRPVVAYVSRHGFGHAMRLGFALKRLCELAPDVDLMIRGAAPPWAYPERAEVVDMIADVGVLQPDSLSTLVEETIARVVEFERARPRLVDAECATLRPLAPRLVIGDIPPLAFDVARQLGVPSIALGNFAWDWIYANLGASYPDVAEITASMRDSESGADVLLRLPLHSDMSAFTTVEDIPFIARVARHSRPDVRRHLGIPQNRTAALLSFGGFELARLDLRVFERLPEIVFVTTLRPGPTLPSNVICCPPDIDHFEDLIAACDVAIIKPGWGTISDCIANRVPIVYTTRPGFPEEQALVRGMQDLMPAVFVPQEAVFAGELQAAIYQALNSAESWKPVVLDGADAVARRILTMAGCSPTGELTYVRSQ